MGTQGSLGALGGETAGTPNFENTQAGYFQNWGSQEFCRPGAQEMPWEPKGSLGALGGETAGTPNFENTQVAISEKLWGMES